MFELTFSVKQCLGIKANDRIVSGIILPITHVLKDDHFVIKPYFK